jgi:hypothetical protein
MKPGNRSQPPLKQTRRGRGVYRGTEMDRWHAQRGGFKTVPARPLDGTGLDLAPFRIARN